MMNNPFVITMSREIGSGAACVGKQIAKRLDISYVDREILAEAAKHFMLPEGELESIEERTPHFWQNLFKSGTYVPPEIMVNPPVYLPTDRELFETESKIIARVAREYSSVVIGRGGSDVLKDHPRLLSVFLHADLSFRLKRVQEMFRLSEKAAKAFIEKTDNERARYLQAFTGRDWKDLRQYHLSINTAVIGFQETEELIIACAKARFGIPANSD